MEKLAQHLQHLKELGARAPAPARAPASSPALPPQIEQDRSGPPRWRHVQLVCSCPCSWNHVWSRTALFLAAVCLLTRPVMPEVIYRVDPLGRYKDFFVLCYNQLTGTTGSALLAATLRTYQRAGCDSEQLSLSCPRGTSISIELAQYGRAGDLTDHSLCPPVSQEDLTTTGSAGDAVIHSGTEIEVKPPEACTVSGLQYALLQTVVDACQKKRHCKFAANSKTHSSGDPCSGIRKFVEIAYKCRPYEFRSKVACENDNMPLVCNPYSRIAIYSASFGHTERESVQCGGQSAGASTGTGTSEDNGKPTCLVSYATETVMQICHGRRRCSVTADAGTFGRPCKADVRMYLKVVYTCIPRKVLKDRYETAPEGDEPQQSELDMDQDELYDEDQFYKESEAIPPAPKLQGAIPNVGMPFDFGNGALGVGTSSTLLPPLLSRDDSLLEEHQEQFYLYLIISVAAGVLLCLTLVIGRLTLQKRRGERKNSSSSGSGVAKSFADTQGGNTGVGNGGASKFQQTTPGEAHLPDSFADDISDIDADIDLTGPMPLPSLSSRNETYMTYAPTPKCSYAGLPSALSHPTSGATTVLMAPHSQANSYTTMGHPATNGPLTMGPHFLGPSGLGTVSPAYLSGAVMVAGHHHTLRRTLIPTSMGIMSSPSPPPTSISSGHPLPLTAMPSTSNSGCGVYYDSTVPRNLTRGVSTESSAQYFYG
ncbi:GL12345 [Drosophila persimilis]|uniref:GL12345 n=1 Tax=Drosophila persimilis TaxID=7234 RepID=B4GM90_DROPE|nr:GL12345 [Drosophila persimilis]